MVEIVNMEQGSQEWHDLREKHYKTASRTPIVCEVSPHQSREQLAMQLRGEYEPFRHNAMRRGNELEDKVRILVEEQLNDVFQPLVGLRNGYLASLDGINFNRDTIIEIKVSEKTYLDIEKGVIPEVYMYQIQHQMMVFDEADQAYLCAFNPKTEKLIVSKPIKPDGDYANEIKECWDKFDLEKDELKIEELDLSDDEEFTKEIEEYREEKLKELDIKKSLDSKKKSIIKRFTGVKIKGNKVSVFKVEDSETIDYKKLYEENQELFEDIDLDDYKKIKKGSIQIRLS